MRNVKRDNLRRLIASVAALVLIVVVIWVDVTTTIWQELVILSGLAAGLVTFLLTSLFIDRFIQRAQRRRWAPVTRLALTEVLHQFADDQHSELTKGHIEPRRLPTLVESQTTHMLLSSTRGLRATVARERTRLSTVLGTWWNFLSATPGTDDLVRHIADATLLFDRVRDASLELDTALEQRGVPHADEQSRAALATLNTEVLACNSAIAGIVREINSRLAADTTTLSQEAQHTLNRLRRSPQ